MRKEDPFVKYIRAHTNSEVQADTLMDALVNELGYSFSHNEWSQNGNPVESEDSKLILLDDIDTIINGDKELGSNVKDR